jgi:phage terminase large subunit
MDLTDAELEELQALLELQERERVSLKMERFREPWRIKLCKGGRGAGAKSHGATSLLCQLANSHRLRIGVFREVQLSMEESSHALFVKKVEYLQYPGWTVTKGSLTSPVGSRIIFRGLNDLKSARQTKGLEDFDIFFLEEAAQISDDSIRMLLPSLRKPGSELWAIYNQENQNDPIDRILWQSDREDVLRIFMEEGAADNPWWTAELEAERRAAYREDREEARHVWGGLPRRELDRALYSPDQVLLMGERETDGTPVEEGGIVEIGCDVARFGKDKTIAFKRKGMHVIARKECAGYDTVEVAGMLWALAEQDRSVPIKVDSGYNPGVIDLLKQWGANVEAIGFGELALNKDLYPNCASEMYFTLPVEKLTIPKAYLTRTLIEDLTERYFTYDALGRRKIEPKDGNMIIGNESKKNFKARHGGRSPDEGDALVLCFYEKHTSWALL